ncbi:MAG: pyruvate formate lyase family protein, partial [Coriobacteriia bacterium]|nr:pyruvate formate lyase family protein [Coriobacteriia bacterium]
MTKTAVENDTSKSAKKGGKVDYQSFADTSRGETIWDSLNPMRYSQTISLARAQILTDAYEEYDGYQLFHKRGLAIAKILREIPIYLDDDQLLAGDFAAKPMAPEFHPDLAGAWLGEYAENFGTEGSESFFGFASDEECQQAKDISHFWRNIGGKEMYLKFIGDEEVAFEDKIGEANGWIVNTVSEMFAEKAWCVPDLARLVTKGIRGLLADVDERLERLLITTHEEYMAHEFLVGLKEILLAGIDYAHRYRDLALAKAAEETNPQRKAELEELARVCDRVPEYPAETFQEALQATFFGILMIFYDTRTYGMGYGRVDQYMYPQYQADIANGHIDDEYATQLLECFRVKLMGKRQFWPDVMVANLTAESHFHNCVIGGVDPMTGKDATNELSYLWLEAATRVKTPHPTLSVRWHAQIDRKFMDRALEVVSMGMGFPAFFNDQSSITYLLSRGYTLEEARDYAVGGCVLHQVPGKQSVVWPLVTNYGKIMELALYNGFDPRMDEQMSIETGDFAKMDTFDEFVEAFKAQSRHWAEISTKSSRACRVEHGDSFPEVLMSAFIDDCIERG